MARAELNVPVAILAGGLATRMRPLTEKTPKVLLEVAGRPFLEHQLDLLREQGIRDIVLCVGHLGEAIQKRYGDGRAHGVRLHYSFDGPVLLGTGGAIRQALPLLAEAFFVLYGDSYLKVDFAAVFAAFLRSGKNALMTVFENENQWDGSNVEFAEGEIRRYDKKLRDERMRHIDYGLTVARASVFASHPRGAAFDLSETMTDLASRGELAGYEADDRFFEIGSTTGLAELERLLAAGV